MSHPGPKECLQILIEKKYGDEDVRDCLISVAKAQHHCRDKQNEVAQLLLQIILNASDQWLASSYSTSLMVEACNHLDPDVFVLSFSSLLVELRVQRKVEFLHSVMSKVFQQKLFHQLVVQESLEPQAKLTWPKLSSVISSLPNHFANKLQNQTRGNIFHHEKFFELLGLDIVSCIEVLVSEVSAGKNVDTMFLSKCIGHFCLVGKADSLFKGLLPAMIYFSKDNFVWGRILHKTFSNVPDRCMETVLCFLFQTVPVHCIHLLLGELVSTNSKAKFTIQHKLLLVKHFKSFDIVENIFSYLHSCDDSSAILNETLLKLLEVWKSKTAIKQTPYAQHKHVSAAILVCVRYLRAVEGQQRDALLQVLMKGMENHLESPDAQIRTLGMLVGEKVTEALHLPVKDDARLKFDYPKNQETKHLLTLLDRVDEKPETFFKEQLEIYQKVKSEHAASSTNDTKTVFMAPKSAFVEMAAIQNLKIDDSLDGNDEQDRDNEETVTDSDDDLEAYPMPSETSFSKIAKPMYIRDCMDGLINNDSREKMEIYLVSLIPLIEIDVVATKEVAAELCKVLLNLQNNYALDEFPIIRRNALASLAALNPEPVAAYLTGEFYSEHYGLQQRVDILDVIVMAAGRLSALQNKRQDLEQKDASKRIVELPEPGARPAKPGNDSKSELPWQQVVAERIEAKTRRFGKARKPPPEAEPNRFQPVAGAFFYPLMAGYDKRVRTLDLLGSDTVVLGRLLYTLGVVLYSCAGTMMAEPMSAALLEFVTSLRRHTEPFVRRACVYCISMVTASAPRLTERLAGAALEGREWLCDVISGDEDEQTRALAANTLTLLDMKARDELRVVDSVT